MTHMDDIVLTWMSRAVIIGQSISIGWLLFLAFIRPGLWGDIFFSILNYFLAILSLNLGAYHSIDLGLVSLIILAAISFFMALSRITGHRGACIALGADIFFILFRIKFGYDFKWR